MNLAEISIKRPIFISCVVILMIVVGMISYKKMPVDQFPDVSFPIVFAEILYPGASPIDVERQISKIVEDEVSSLPGLETITSNNYDSVAVIVIKFRLGTDIKEAEQQVRNRIQNVRNKLPEDAKEPVIRRFDPADQPIVMLALNSALPQDQLFDVANEIVKPVLERTKDVGQLRIVGGRKKEIEILVDKNKLQDRQLSMVQVAKKIEDTSKDIPIGNFSDSKNELAYRTSGEFSTIDQIKDVAVNFVGSDRPVKLKEIAEVREGLEEAKRYSSINGKTALFLMAYKQSGSNTVEVADRLKAQVEPINELLKSKKIDAQMLMIRDGSIPVRLNVADVRESIFIGIVLCIIVVFFFLGSARSTFITGLALPNSLLGGFVIMYLMGFSINIMTLIALSLAVGLLIDDAIVVRENIFRHLEMGKSPKQAALEGTKEVAMAVVATTLVVIAVFGPIAFVPGIVGQFFKQFGLTVVFTMLISLFDAFTVAPMLSAYLATNNEHVKGKGLIGRTLAAFDRGQTHLENFYAKVLGWTINHRKTVLLSAVVIFVFSLSLAKYIPKTFITIPDTSEFTVTVETKVGSSLESTASFAKQVETLIKDMPEVELVALTVGSQALESHKAEMYVHLVNPSKRKGTTTQMVKERVRVAAEKYKSEAIISVTDVDISGGGQKPLNLYLVGDNLDELSAYAFKLQAEMQKIKGLVDVDTNFRAGKPEYHVVFDRERSEALGVSTVTAGAELRYRTEGAIPATFRQNGIDYDVRLKFPDSEKNLKENFATTLIPNQNFNMVPLSRVAKGESVTGYSQINRQNKGRFIAITGNLGTGGNMGDITVEIEKLLAGDFKPPLGASARFEGQAQDMKDLMQNMMIAMGLGVLLIYLVLASLYESFVTPFSILPALPLAISGAFGGILLAGVALDLFSMIGMILLLGVVAKNSILLVDYAKQLIEKGMPERDALIESGKTRLRPILMTTLALISGILPIAIGITPLGTQRQSMGVAIIGGLISSTLLTLVVVPAIYGYVERFRRWSLGFATRLVHGADAGQSVNGQHSMAQGASRAVEQKTVSP